MIDLSIYRSKPISQVHGTVLELGCCVSDDEAKLFPICSTINTLLCSAVEYFSSGMLSVAPHGAALYQRVQPTKSMVTVVKVSVIVKILVIALIAVCVPVAASVVVTIPAATTICTILTVDVAVTITVIVAVN
jgi:hypothetical protein